MFKYFFTFLGEGVGEFGNTKSLTTMLELNAEKQIQKTNFSTCTSKIILLLWAHVP